MEQTRKKVDGYKDAFVFYFDSRQNLRLDT